MATKPKLHTTQQKIDGRLHKVFLLEESDDHLLVITVESLIGDDYAELNKIAAKVTPNRSMLTLMMTEKCTNGMFAITRYDKLITLVNKKTERRVRAPEDMSVIEILTNERDTALDSIKNMEATVVNAMKNKPVSDDVELVKEYFIIIEGQEYTWDGVSNKKKKVREFLDAGNTIDDMEVRMVPTKR